MEVVLIEPTGSTLNYNFESRQATVADLKERVQAQEGVPASLVRVFPPNSDMSVVAADDTELMSLGSDGSTEGVTLRIMYNANGGADVASCGNFSPALKLLCFECHLGGEWKQQQCCCLKVNCVIS